MSRGKWALVLAVVVVLGAVAAAYAAGQAKAAASGAQQPKRITVDLGHEFTFWAEEWHGDKGTLGGAILQGSEVFRGSQSQIWTVYYLGKEANGTGHLKVVKTDVFHGTSEAENMVFTAAKGARVCLTTGTYGKPVVTFAVNEVSDKGISVALLAVEH